MDVFGVVVIAVSSSGAIVWLFREWLSIRLKGAIKHEYDLKLQNESTILEQQKALYTHLFSSCAKAQSVSLERSLSAWEHLWSAIIDFRNSLPRSVWGLDIISEEELGDVYSNPIFSIYADELSYEEAKQKFVFPKTLEVVRPYVGEYIWFVVLLYFTTLGRIVFLIIGGKEDPGKLIWFKDGYNRRLMCELLSKQEIAEFDALEIGKIRWINNKIEAIILKHMRQVQDGSFSITESSEQAKRIASLIKAPAMCGEDAMCLPNAYLVGHKK